MSNFLKSKKTIFFLILVLFLLMRLPGLHLPYHQDERKAVMSYSDFKAVGTPHPPLTRTLFALDALIFGRDNFRAMPLVFGFLNIFLLFYLVRMLFGARPALWVILFFSVSFYSVLGSLMTEMDGQVLPAFFLLSLIFYFKWKDSLGRQKILWGLALVIAVILGFLTKLNFIIAVGAIVLDFIVSKRRIFKNKKLLFKYSIAIVGFLFLLALVLLNAKFFFKSYDISMTLNHVKDFVKFSGRSYLQIVIQISKAVMYASPLLLVPLLFVRKNDLKRFKIFWIFLFLGGVFYLIIFDFSTSALDKYLAFVIVPLSIISGVITHDILKEKNEKLIIPRGELIFFGLVLGGLIFIMQFLPHFVPPLYPKEEWVKRIIYLKWNFLFVFTGGSGPLGFYVSWLLIAVSWLSCLLLAVLAIIKNKWRKLAMCSILMIGLFYNVAFAEEYLFGKINGNPNTLLKDAVQFIKNNPSISSVITYNDIGGYELIKINKYEKRIYAVPKYESVHRNTLNDFKGYYLVIDIPHLNPNTLYGRYFSSCKIIYEKTSNEIKSRVYDCQKAIVPN